MITITIWNCDGLPRQTINNITDSLFSSSLIFLIETWLLQPLQFLTLWKKFYIYEIPVEGTYRGKMGITLLANPSFPYHITHLPSKYPYVLSCQVSNTLIYCFYLPPSLPNIDAIKILRSLPDQTHPSQTNMIYCGNFNARHHSLLGDSRTSKRVTLMIEWMIKYGLACWNYRFAFGVPTYSCKSRQENTGLAYISMIYIFFSHENLPDPQLQVHEELSMSSDHHPVSLSYILSPPPSLAAHPRILWRLSRLIEPDCFYEKLFIESLPFEQ